eukprot:g2681.t1
MLNQRVDDLFDKGGIYIKADLLGSLPISYKHLFDELNDGREQLQGHNFLRLNLLQLPQIEPKDVQTSTPSKEDAFRDRIVATLHTLASNAEDWKSLVQVFHVEDDDHPGNFVRGKPNGRSSLPAKGLFAIKKLSERTVLPLFVGGEIVPDETLQKLIEDFNVPLCCHNQHYKMTENIENINEEIFSSFEKGETGHVSLDGHCLDFRTVLNVVNDYRGIDSEPNARFEKVFIHNFPVFMLVTIKEVKSLEEIVVDRGELYWYTLSLAWRTEALRIEKIEVRQRLLKSLNIADERERYKQKRNFQYDKLCFQRLDESPKKKQKRNSVETENTQYNCNTTYRYTFDRSKLDHANGSRSVLVKNIDSNVLRKEIEDHMSSAGNIVDIIMERFNGNAIVVYSAVGEAIKAIQTKTGTDIKGRDIIVEEIN